MTINSKKRASDAAYRARNSERIRERMHAYYAEHRGRILSYQSRYYAQRSPAKKAYQQAYRAGKREDIRAKAHLYARRLRKDALDIYGGKCACCDEYEYEFLAIDHVEGGGNRHRKSIGVGAGTQFYRWLKKNNFPPGYRVLCHNCNSALGYYGKCPHETQMPTVVVSETARSINRGGGVESGYIGDEVMP